MAGAKGFDELAKQIERINHQLEQRGDAREFCQAVAKELAARLLSAAIKRTPTVSGTLRRGWTAKTEEDAAKGAGAMGVTEYAETLRITKSGNAYEIEVVNPVHYASYVEFGHRQEPGRYVPAIGKRLKQGWVPGQFILTISEKEVQRWADGNLQKKLEKWLEDMMHDG